MSDRLQKYRENAHVNLSRQARQEAKGWEQKYSALEAEHKALKMEHNAAKRTLSVHEKREKARQDGLKKAQAARKKGGKK